MIDVTGQNLGVLSLEKAIRLAVDSGFDLIEIAPNAVPPVAKIMNFGKFQYLENKKQKLGKAKKGSETKNIQIKLGTGDHDLLIKAGKTSQFLEEGHRVRVELFLPGRAKYFDRKFLEERLGRLLKLITASYRVAEPPQPSPKGLITIVEKTKQA